MAILPETQDERLDRIRVLTDSLIDFDILVRDHEGTVAAAVADLEDVKRQRDAKALELAALVAEAQAHGPRRVLGLAWPWRTEP